MAKGFILADVPESCSVCKYFCHEFLRETPYCNIMDDKTSPDCARKINCNAGKDKSNWCPIKELPKRKEKKEQQEYLFGKLGKAFDAGWNACLDYLEEK